MPTLQKTKIYYDALGRPVRTVNPNGSEQWAFQGIPDDIVTPVNPSLLSGVEAFTPTPWENYAYDSNDLADIVVVPNNNVPSSHYGTPKNSLVDALGRTTKTKEFFDNTDSTNVIEMNYSFDIRGNLLLVKDPYNRNVFEHVYDLRVGEKDSPAPPLWTKHIDKGISTVWFDAVGKPIRGDDAKGAVVLSSYDVISRPKNSWASNKTGDAITLRGYSVYGDSASLPSPQNSNLNGQVYESYDEAGKLEMTLYDFKSNLITKVRSVIADGDLKTALNSYTNLIIDWDSPPNLSPTIFTSDMAYDALNRITELTLPDDLDLERKKIIPTYNTAGALEKVDLYSPAGPTTTNYVENIAYNAKGQRLLIAFGNDMMTRYTYDPITFRLLRQRTEGYTKSAVGSTITYTYGAGTNKQDDAFNFDLVGNIVNIFTRVTDCGIGGNPDELDRVFEYDPIYRLTYADGRESDTQSGNTYLYDDAPIPSTPLPSNVNYYERNFVYDKLGNIESVVQSGTNGFTRDYTYNSGKNTLQKIENATPTVIESYTYDSNGNTLTTNLNRYYVWNHSDQLLGYYNQAGLTPTVSTQYDYAGQDRVSKMVRTASGNSFERTIYIDGIFEYIRLDNTSGTFEKNYIHIMDDKSRICEVRINPGTPFPGDITDDVVYVLEDQIGSSVVRLNTSGTVIDEEEYYPFGDSSLRTFTYKRYRYVGKEKDAESGLYYYGARYYAAWTCRFISVDPLAGKYANLSPYNYADNNPINDFDIDGMQNNNSAGTPMSAPTGSGGGVPQGNTGTNSTTDKTKVNNTPSAYTKPLNPTDKTTVATKKFELKKDNVAPKKTIDFTKLEPRQPDMLYDANSIDAPGAMDRLSEGAIAGQTAKKTMDAYHASGGDNGFMEFSIVFHNMGAPVIQSIGSGYQIYKGGSGGGPLPYSSTSNVEQRPPVYTKALTTQYPTNPSIPGTTGRTFLMPGQQIDRFGSLGGKWFSQPGVSFGERSIPPGTGPYSKFTVLKPFEVEVSKASPGFFSGQTGFGIQFKSPVSAEVLIKHNIISKPILD